MRVQIDAGFEHKRQMLSRQRRDIGVFIKVRGSAWVRDTFQIL
jgi:hypothetical protein